MSLQDLRQNQSPETIFEVRSARWPDGPTQSGVAHEFCLIPVSGVGVVVGDEKIGRNEVQGTFNKDLTNDGMIFEAHKQIVKPFSQTCDHIWRAQACAERKRARVCARSGVICERMVYRQGGILLIGRRRSGCFPWRC